ncbi:MAG: cytochrome c oxidase subunit II [Actinobacteria bacterium]|nr:cytochrome c oxidase subunit II [Actinomycetota bacterium]
MSAQGGSRERPPGRWARSRWVPSWVAWALLAFATGACGAGALDPAGPDAQRLADLFWLLLVSAGVVVVITLGLMGYALWRRRDDGDDEDPARSQPWENRVVTIGGIVIPTVILMSLLGVTINALVGEAQSGDLQIQVVGHQYWWEIYYPDADFETANELHVPTGRQVELTLESDDVIHSFWIPQLAGKTDLVPGRTNTMVFQADEPGVYEGVCAEYCGLQHTHMRFLVIAQEPAEYDAWVRAQAQPASGEGAEGRRVFLESSCAGCHTIRGTEATGDLGPDLTHLMERRTIGANTLELTPENLARFVADTQDVKPGAEMPPMADLYSEDEFAALLEYLRTLE